MSATEQACESGCDSNAIDGTLLQAIAASIETTINTALIYDPSSRKKIARLHDTLAINISTPAITLYIHGQENGVAVLTYCEAPVATQLSGSAFALMGLLNQPASLANSGVALTGNVHLLQQWQNIVETLDIDWEDAISRVLGDIAGPLVSRNIQRSSVWLTAQAKEQQRLISEYLSEELHVVPSKPEIEAFINDIGDITLHTDRLTARIDALQKQWQTTQQEKPTS